MGPFLILYALPTVLAFAAILAVYKASGLVDRLTLDFAFVAPEARPALIRALAG